MDEEEFELDIEEYEKQLKEIKEKNKHYLKEFEKYLKDQNLSDKTINNHLNNMQFYLDEYLNYYEPTPMEEGIYDAGLYLSDWFIRKCLWSSKNSIKETAASIKKFYKCMAELGHVDKKEYEELADEIKENMPVYLENLESYEDGNFFPDFI